jgi:hypothetical protein
LKLPVGGEESGAARMDRPVVFDIPVVVGIAPRLGRAAGISDVRHTRTSYVGWIGCGPTIGWPGRCVAPRGHDSD